MFNCSFNLPLGTVPKYLKFFLVFPEKVGEGVLLKERDNVKIERIHQVLCIYYA